ncbi:MAG: glucose-6-phosphate isomerase [Xanthomonadales bacterium]|nr:glucose-6-phosphate isomerase [Xanthomonadales bacterium]
MALPDITPLAQHAARLAGQSLAGLVADDAAGARAGMLVGRLGPLYLDLTRQLLDAPAWQALLDYADAAGVDAARDAMLAGAPVNRSENRAALHAALRAGDGGHVRIGAAVRDEISATLARLAALATTLREAPRDLGLPRITDVVSIGIGGSDLGPRLACQSLARAGSGGPRVHFLANVDGCEAARLCSALDPASTVVILISKSFGTRETLLNGRVMRDWLAAALGREQADARLFAVSANVAAAQAFGVAPERVLPMWDFVGGRYSLWSAVGLPIAIAIGADGFAQLLAGARAMDEHFAEAALADSLPVRLALVGFWNRSLLGHASRCVVPYDDRLAALPGYLQQLEMESNGKRVGVDGQPVPLPTVPVVWGSVGSNAQHAYFQALHQGSDIVPVDLIGVIQPDHDLADNHRALLANLLGQGAALMLGSGDGDGAGDAVADTALAAQKHFPGNRPSTTILLDRLTPQALGLLLALYEHATFVQSVLWGVNAFDQWGVELGKTLAGRIEPALAQAGSDDELDPVTRRLLAEIRSRRADANVAAEPSSGA